MNCSNCESAEATFICNECNTVFCSKCSSEIHSLPIFKGHKITETNTTSLCICPTHNKIELLFCEACLECCCWECVCTGQKHAGHKVVSFETAYSERKTVLEKRLAELRAVTAISRTVEAVLERESQRWGDQCQATRDKIAATFEKTAEAVKARKDKALEEIEQKFAENDKLLNDVMDEFKTTEEASKNALKEGRELGSNQTENLAKIGKVEHSVEAISDLNERILHKVIPGSYSVKFKSVFLSESEVKKEEKKEKKEGEEETSEKIEEEEEKEEEKNEIVGLIERFGKVVVNVNGENFDKLLRVKEIKNEEGKEVKDMSKTHVTLSWDDVQSCYLEHARNGKLNFVLKMRTIELIKPKKEEDKKEGEEKEEEEKDEKVNTSEEEDKKEEEVEKKEGKEEESEKVEKKDEKVNTSEEVIIYTGSNTEYRIDNLNETSKYTFRLYALSNTDTDTNPYQYWQSNELTLTLGSYQGKWRLDCPRAIVDPTNPAIVKAKDGSRDTVIADTPLVPGMINKWRIRLIHSGDGWWEWLGVAPEDINLTKSSNETECGWYLNTLKTTLYAGPPFNYDSQKYGRNSSGEIRKGSIIGLTMDMAEGTLSYSVNGRDLGVAYKGIPTDKRLYPAAVFNSSSQKIEIMPWVEDDVAAGVDSTAVGDDDDDDDDDSSSGMSDDSDDDDSSGYGSDY